MRWATDAWQWLRFLRRASSRESNLDDELRFHLDHQTRKNLATGMPPDEARRQALIRFGGLESVRESTRDELRPPLLEGLLRDLRLWRPVTSPLARLHDCRQFHSRSGNWGERCRIQRCERRGDQASPVPSFGVSHVERTDGRRHRILHLA